MINPVAVNKTIIIAGHDPLVCQSKIAYRAIQMPDGGTVDGKP